ncbi:VC0807 family protein [Deinococcus peraridilitoris]|uniref:MFS transporter n=1 Tax=Deinococcus peraridilitoris (strain DSM 19664 / LMG 22246 / CIP 109416 / KR-200) TaxID=937777 RepID=K9ZYD3_DEIPD|nr:VC0807 family protein [Deinococcus peraridilitoris]AFZ66653.1 hypothetical protein Deipe_1090 [Deinococcus peraridilitoris DSM 19664]
MSAPSANSSVKPDAAGRKLLQDLLFTLIIPISVLSPNLLGSGFSFARVLGSSPSLSGTVRAYLLAALVPVAYTAFDLLVRRRVSPIAIFAGATALITGGLAFWFVDGALYAFKDSLLRFLIAALAVVSVWFRYPLFRIFLDASSLTAKAEERQALGKVMTQRTVIKALGAGTLIFALVEVIAGIVNFFVNLRIVTAPFDTPDFNAQVAQANAVMRLPSIVMFLIGFALAGWIVQRAVNARYGKGASLFEPAQLVDKVREDEDQPHGELSRT